MGMLFRNVADVGLLSPWQKILTFGQLKGK